MLKRIGLALLLLASVNPASAFDLKVSSPDLDDELAKDLTKSSLIVELKRSDETVTGQDVLAAARADYARLVGLLYERGYFAPVISIRINGKEAAEISAIAPPPIVQRVEISMQTGPLFRFGKTHLAPLAPKTTIPEGFAPNQPSSTGLMRQALDAGIVGWRNQGFAKAALESQSITARHIDRKIDVDIKLRPGAQLRFGNLVVQGNKAMRIDRIQDIAALPTGKIFDPNELDRAAMRLRRTGVFDVVALSEAGAVGPGQTLDIAAQLVEAKPRRIGFGVELSTQEGLSVSGYWLHRNLWGGGERLRIEGEISGIEGETGGEDYALGLRFGRPATFNEDTDFYATADIEALNEPNFSSDRVALEAGIRRYATPEREYTFGLGFEAANTVDAFGSNSYRLLTLPVGAEFDYRDKALNPKSGYYARASVTPFIGLGDTVNGVRSFLDLRTYRSTGRDDRLTIALRGQLGSVSGPALSDAPADFLFYSGGGGTVRGHDYQSLGVTQAGGAVSGGRSFLGLSGEVRVKTGDKLSLVGFFDAGYIGEEAFPDGSTGDWHTGAGLGVRYDTGVGPVRVDLAVPVSGPGNPSGFQVYIGIGQAF